MTNPPALRKQEVDGSAVDRPRRIVIVEDNVDAGESLQQMLELSGHQVSLATNGRDGVTLVRQFQPDVVLCDLGLPGGMSGFDVARELRADPLLSGLELVALSGYGRDEDKKRSLEARFDHHLTKPADLKTIERILGDRTTRSST